MDVLVAGDLYVDLILSGFESWPQPGQEAFAREFHREIGGGTAITACGLARLGTRTGVLGVVGRDTGAWVVDQLAAHGVDTSEIDFDRVEPTAFTVAVSAPEERAFFTYPGANRRLPEALAAGQFSGTRHVHLACRAGMAEVAAVRAAGCTVSLDIGWHEAWLADPRSWETIAGVDLFFPNEAEGRRLTGESEPEKILACFAAHGAGRVALKLGAEGAALLWDDSIWRVPARSVKPVDTTGAGDCFDAGFLHAWLRGDSPEKCLRAANICGARSTEAHGGIAGFPAREQLESELECEK